MQKGKGADAEDRDEYLAENIFWVPTCDAMGLKVEMLEEKQPLQDAVLSLHHACMLTMSQTGAFKIIENQKGAAFIQAAQVAQVVQAVK